LRDRTIFLHGFSKAWAMTGFVLATPAARLKLIEAMMKMPSIHHALRSSLSQKAALEAWPGQKRTSLNGQRIPAPPQPIW